MDGPTTMDPTRNDCGCCEGPSEPRPIRNDPGLPALDYRTDTQPGFRARMLEALPLAQPDGDAASSPRPLQPLSTRSDDDPSVAFLDACACMADVLAFYQERIANEGFLRTATERRSVLELARAIGYELKPGVAASVHLAFSVEDAPGAPGSCRLVEGTAVQSIPPQGKSPQVFETSAALEARAEWNALYPRRTRPADLGIHEVTDASGNKRLALVLFGPAGSFPAATANLYPGLPRGDLYRLDGSLPIVASVDALEIGRVWFSDSAPGVSSLAGGDLLLFTALQATGTTAIRTLVRRVVGTTPEPARKRIGVDVEPLPDPVFPKLPIFIRIIPGVSLASFGPRSVPRLGSVPLTSSTLADTVTSKVWHESDLKAMIGIQGWNATDISRAVAAPRKRAIDEPVGGAFAFGARVGFFGNNAPKWSALPKTNTNGTAYAKPWDNGDGDSSTTLGHSRTIWEDSQGDDNLDASAAHVFLERAVANVNRDSWAVIDAPDANAQAYRVVDAREASRADFGVSGRAMALRLADTAGNLLSATPAANYRFRSSTAHVASRRLPLAELPIEAPVPAGTRQIELDRMVLGLGRGQLIALTGERDDLDGATAAEIATITDVVHADGRSTLLLDAGLKFTYRRGGLSICANVVHATHGETVSEVLGNGNASIANQRFVLKKPPTTFVSAPTPAGVESTLEVRVNDILWDEVPSLHGVAPNRTTYSTRIDNDARMELIFGDGKRGARLPTGMLNVAARYRSGIGPDGEVDAGTLTQLRQLPLGLRGVTNPVPAAGAAGPEQLDDARRNAPLTLLTFDRVVSASDYEDYARGYPGIGKARGDLLWIDGERVVHLSVAGATGGAAGEDVVRNLRASIAAGSDPSQRALVSSYAQRYFSLRANVAIDRRYVAADVKASVVVALVDAFGFDRREIAQSVTVAEIVALIHTVAGVLAVDVDALEAYPPAASPASTSATVPAALPAFAARWDTRAPGPVAAELLTINPAAVEIGEMSA